MKRRALPSHRQYRARLARAWGMAAVLVIVSTAVGVAGLMATEGLPFVDSLLFSTMILTGTGPRRRS